MAGATRRRAAGGLVVVCAAQFVTGVDGLAVAVALAAPRVLPEGRAEGPPDLAGGLLGSPR